MTFKVSDLESDSDLDSIRNSCDVFLCVSAMHWSVFRKKTEKERAGESSDDPFIVELECATVCRGGFRSQSGRRTDQESETGGTV